MTDQMETTLTQSLEYCIQHRHSIRKFTNDPVDHKLLLYCLNLAKLAASNSHMQNWRLAIATGPARDRIMSALVAAASDGQPQIPPLPEKFAHFRSQFGRTLYGPEGYGISREDKELKAAAVMQNFHFFDAPVVGIITMDQSLTTVDSLSVGLFIQTLMLALVEQGLGSCLEVSVTGYPDVIRAGFKLPEDQQLLCGIAIGRPMEHQVNHLHLEREPIEHTVHFLNE